MNNGEGRIQNFVQLGDLVEIVSGAPFKSDLFNDEGKGLPLIRVRDVNTGPAGIFYSGEFARQFVIENGDLLISMDGVFTCVAWQHGRALLNQRVCKIVPNEKRLSRNYLRLFLPKALRERLIPQSNIYQRRAFERSRSHFPRSTIKNA